MFKEGRELVEDKLHFGRPTPLVLESDRTFALISGETGLSVGTVHTIVKEDILDCIQEDKDFLDKVVTDDETWVFQHDPETKRENSE